MSSVLQRSLSSFLVVAAALALLGVVPATAEDRCEGTLCDLYYDHVAAPAQPAAPQPAATPVTVPSSGFLGRLFSGGQQQPAQPGAQSAAGAQPSIAPPGSRLVAVQGGGLVGLMHGTPQERCSGTLCDLYYGGPPPEAARPEAVAAEPAAAEPVTDEPAAEPKPRRAVEAAERHCSSARDPWNCYR